MSGHIQNARLALAARARTNTLLAPAFRSARALALSSRWGTVEGRLLSNLVRPGTVAIDVGANVGQYSALLARGLRGQGFVLAFEPNPLAFQELERGARGRLIVPLPFALSSAPGTSALNVPTTADGELQIQLGSLGNRSGDSGVRTFEVAIETLDAFSPILRSSVSVIKIDVEGFELEVLKGAEAVLAEHRPPLVLEIEHRHQPEGQQAKDVVDWLMKRGYTVQGVTPHGCIEWNDALQRQSAYKFGTNTPDADYTNTFLCRFTARIL